MPFTPFHFGPGALLHAAAPGRVSFLAFCAVNVLIDIEPGWHMLRDDPPLHRFMHTLPGAALATVATLLLYLGLRRLAARNPLPDTFGWQQLNLPAVAMGAALGAATHLLLDGIMHTDLRPLRPFSEANPLYQWLSLEALHWACVASGGLAIRALVLRALWSRRRTG